MYHKWRSFGAWFLRYKAQQSNFFVIFGHFCPLTLLTIWKIKILKKKLKRYLEISFYTCLPQMAIIWCMIFKIWSPTFLLFWAIFCSFTPIITQKIKNFEKMKKKKNAWGYHHFTQVYLKSWLYRILFLRYSTWWI